MQALKYNINVHITGQIWFQVKFFLTEVDSQLLFSENTENHPRLNKN